MISPEMFDEEMRQTSADQVRQHYGPGGSYVTGHSERIRAAAVVARGLAAVAGGLYAIARSIDGLAKAQEAAEPMRNSREAAADPAQTTSLKEDVVDP